MYKAGIPPKIDQGVILKEVYFYSVDQKHYAFVLTPACDIEQQKAELVQLCALAPANQLIDTLKRTSWTKATGKELKNNIRQVITQKLPRYHWFAPLPGTEMPLVADFQNIATLPLAEVSRLELVAWLESPFREQVPARYAAYMGRVGTPDHSSEVISQWIDLLAP